MHASLTGPIPFRSLVLALVLCLGCGPSEDVEEAGAGSAGAAGVGRRQAGENPLRDVYFGETHVHTAYSLDAYIGGTRLTPSDAYRYAKGEAVEVDGEPRQRRRPLDFAAVTDHAEYLGEMYSTIVEGAPGHDQPLLEQLRGLETLAEKQQWFLEYVVENHRGTTPQHPEFFAGQETLRDAWQVTIDAAEAHDRPGEFTALIGFEWSGAPDGANLHRNVIFRGAEVPDAPVSYIDVGREDGLWEWMAGLEAEGIRALAIPHNSNASKGVMFGPLDGRGEPIDLEYAERRAHFEPLVEMMQVKGSSEVHRSFWATDEFAGFENADSIQENSGRTFHKRDFVREGLKLGLAHELELGANPFKLGFIGGTDNHDGMPSAVAEDGFVGAHGPEDGSVERRRDAGVGGWIDGRELSVGSLAAVWATANTRAALWDAMQRRETYATSGPRIRVRFFAGVDLEADPRDPVKLVEEGYARGVPMGGTLDPIGSSPSFSVHALKDPEGANLDRIQIVKAWVDEAGELHERIVDVVWAGDRGPGLGGKLPPIGDTVDLATATYTNGIGAPELIGSWTDEDWNPNQLALYYARVLEIPTPRWSTYDAVRAGLPLLEDVPATIQERAWTSPIWVTQ